MDKGEIEFEDLYYKSIMQRQALEKEIESLKYENKMLAETNKKWANNATKP